MASWAKQKALKLKRQKRLFPKSYSADYIHVGSRPGSGHPIIQMQRESSQSLAFDAKYGEYLAEARFKNVPPGRVEARDTAMAIQNKVVHPSHYLSVVLNEMPATWCRIKDVCPSLINFVVEDTMKRHVRLFRNQQNNRFILLELHHIGRFMRASMVYQDKERVLSRFASNTVRWVEFVSSSPPKPEDY